ncbi:cohesin domain-containing protein [Natronoflexus pectinivorans]|uniref:Putative secreted protein (Por secretion system target) n=1 Tax=Natronoflexus pectinivorans TaxID=682526 RepID=A0A4V2RWR4_9BACT|nr:cohesin domain-containing protein [Natronoflexus pectinivorans]TCO09681.1 putative secreted protein (Por secretion system target) [Natronoflexus pectinivorans]
MRNCIKELIVLSLIVLFGQQALFSENAVVKIGTVTDCSYEIAVPVEVSNFNNVGAISLVLEYNEEEFTYVNYQNRHADIGSGMLIVNGGNGRVMISWIDTNPVSIDDGVLLELEFEVLKYGSSSLGWDLATPGNCEISNDSGEVLDVSFQGGSVTLLQPPSITLQPTTQSILENGTAVFSVSAQGTQLSYQWQVSEDGGETFSDLSNAAPYSNVTTANLRVTNASIGLSGNLYRCHVSGTCSPSVFSNNVLLEVIKPVIASMPSLNICPGTHSIPIETEGFIDVSSFSLAIGFNADVVEFLDVDNFHPDFNNAVVVNQEDGIVYLSWAALEPMTIIDEPLFELLVNVEPGNSQLQWQVESNEFFSSFMNEIPGVYNNGSLQVNSLPQITNQPPDRVIAENQNVTFPLSATGTGLSYRWQISTDGGETFTDLNNGSGYSGVTTATLSISSVGIDLDENVYRCRITGACEPTLHSREATLTVLPNISTSLGTSTICPGEIAIPVRVSSFSRVGAFSLALEYNDEVLEFTGYSSLHESLRDGMFAVNADEGVLYLSWVGTTAASIPDNGVLVEFEFDGVPGSSPLNWRAGSEYVNINGLDIFSSYQNGNINVPQNPVINSHPEDQSIYGTGSVQFAVQASGAGLSYQWQESTDSGENWSDLSNGGHYSGVTSTQLTLSNVTSEMQGNLYRCKISGSCPPVVFSNAGKLEVTTPLISVSFDHNTGLCAGMLYLPIKVTNANNLGAISLVVAFDSDDVDFYGYDWVHSEMEDGVLSVNQIGDLIYISWASAEPANVGDDMLIELRFDADLGVSTSFSWVDEEVEFSDFNGNQIPFNLGNQSISISHEHENYFETDEDELCQGDVYYFGRQNLTEPGTYTEMFKAYNGCDSTVLLTLVVLPSPEVTMPDDEVLCINDVPLVLSGALPVGGVFSGSGVQEGIFDPQESGVGVHEIEYLYTSENGCKSIGVFIAEVFPLSEIVMPSDLQLCLNDAPLELPEALPVGGIYSGSGVYEGFLNPRESGIGVHEIEYLYTDENGCTSTGVFSAEVFTYPEIVMPPDLTLCTNDSPIELSGATPVGGQYSGLGVMDGSFDPQISGDGLFDVEYFYTDGNGCIGEGVMQITVEVCTGFNSHELKDMKVWPNPAKEEIFIDASRFLSVIIYDITGREVIVTTVDVLNQKIDVSGLPIGVYVVNLCSDEGCESLKLIIQR